METNWRGILALCLLIPVAHGAVNESTLRHHHFNYGLLNASLDYTPEITRGSDESRAIIHSQHEPHLIRSSVIFGLTKMANSSQVSRSCYSHLQQVQRGILSKQPWAMKGE